MERTIRNIEYATFQPFLRFWLTYVLRGSLVGSGWMFQPFLRFWQGQYVFGEGAAMYWLCFNPS